MEHQTGPALLVWLEGHEGVVHRTDDRDAPRLAALGPVERDPMRGQVHAFPLEPEDLPFRSRSRT